MQHVQTKEEVAAIPNRILVQHKDGGFDVYVKGDTLPTRKVPVVFPKLPANQFLAKLNAAGLREPVETLIESADQTTKDFFHRTTEFERQHPVVAQLAQQLGLTPEQVDALWLAEG